MCLYVQQVFLPIEFPTLFRRGLVQRFCLYHAYFYDNNPLMSLQVTCERLPEAFEPELH